MAEGSASEGARALADCQPNVDAEAVGATDPRSAIHTQ